MKLLRSPILFCAVAVLFVGCSSDEEALGQQEISDVLVADGIELNIADCAASAYLDTFSEDIYEVVDVDLADRVSDCADSAEALAEIRSRSEGVAELAFVDEEPYTYGDDEELDALWEACDAGEGLACDQLFADSPISSDYETFGLSCGRRTDVLRCADLDDPENLQPIPEIAVPTTVDSEAETTDGEAEETETTVDTSEL